MNDRLCSALAGKSDHKHDSYQRATKPVLFLGLLLVIFATCQSQCSLEGCVSNRCTQTNGIQTCSECQSSYFLTSDGQCSRCASSCQTCTSASRCSGCLSGLYLNTATMTCEACSSHCTSCTDKDKCAACASGYSLDSSNQCAQDASTPVSLTALSPWAIVGYCTAGVLCMVCCWLQYLYQRRRLEDERKKLNETKKELASLPEAAKAESQPKFSSNTPLNAKEPNLLEPRQTSKIGSRQELQVQNFSSAVSTSRNLNLAVEVSVSNHYHISKLPSTKKVVVKNSGLFMPRRSGFGVADLSPHNLLENVSMTGSKVPADKLSIASGLVEKDLPTPHNNPEKDHEEGDFNVMELGGVYPSKAKASSNSQPIISARSTSNNHFKAFKNQKQDIVLKTDSESQFDGLGHRLGQDTSPANSVIKNSAPNVAKGRSSTHVAKPATLKDIAPVKEETPVPPKYSTTEHNMTAQPPSQISNITNRGSNTARVLPIVAIRADPTQQSDNIPKSANNKSSADSGANFSNFRETLVLDLQSAKKSTPTKSKIMMKQFSSDERFEVVFSRQKSPAPEVKPGMVHSRRESVRSPLLLVNSGKKDHSTPKSTLQD